METKDKFTVGIAGLALFVSIASGSFTYWQYSLNYARDQREIARDKADRTPIVNVTSKRVEGLAVRRFELQFDLLNRPFSEVELVSIALTAPSDYVFWGGAINGIVQRFTALQSSASDNVQNLVRFKSTPISVNERTSFTGLVDVPDALALPPGAHLSFTIKFRILDNADTLVWVDRTVAIQP